MSVSSVPACEPGQVVHSRLRWFLSLALMSALLNSSVPTPALSPLPGGAGSGAISASASSMAAMRGRAHRLVRGGQPGRTRGGSAHPDPACPGGGRGGALLFSLADSFWTLCWRGSWPGLARAPDRRRQCGAAAFWPQGWGKRAALSATLSFTAGLALGPVFSGLALQQDLYPTTLPFC